jgi:hypothetical protein
MASATPYALWLMFDSIAIVEPATGNWDDVGSWQVRCVARLMAPPRAQHARARRLRRVVSGGQTGVDQAALRAAQDVGLEIGGWVPPEGRDESGPIPLRFLVHMKKTWTERSEAAPAVARSLRTERNARDSDATLILRSRSFQGNDPGTVWTVQCATKHENRPPKVVDPDDDGAFSGIVEWLRENDVETLNVAGPSESTQPGVNRSAHALLVRVFEAHLANR